MKNNLLFLSVVIGISLLLLSYYIGYNKGLKKCVNEADILHSDTNDIMSLYIPNDIMSIYFAYNEIYLEQGGDPIEFPSRENMYTYIEETTAYASCIHGYKENLDWLISQGYVYAKTVYNEDEQYTELFYNGPNWTVDTTIDTSYTISIFNNVEKIYEPKTKTVYYESYTVD